MNSKTKSQLIVWSMISLTLGLAPFQPEPHIIGKLRWVMGGAAGMTGMDWFDLVLHGFPWVILGYWLVRSAIEFIGNKKAAH